MLSDVVVAEEVSVEAVSDIEDISLEVVVLGT